MGSNADHYNYSLTAIRQEERERERRISRLHLTIRITGYWHM
jgi:hypothetical protein